MGIQINMHTLKQTFHKNHSHRAVLELTVSQGQLCLVKFEKCPTKRILTDIIVCPVNKEKGFPALQIYTIRIMELLLLKLTRQRNLLKVLHIFANDAKDLDKPAFVSLVHPEFPVTTMKRLSNYIVK